MNARIFVAVIAMAFCVGNAAAAEKKQDYVKSASAISNSDDYSDLSKLNWTITLNGRKLVIDCHGRMLVDGQNLAFATESTKTDLISGVEYLSFGDYTLVEIGYDNFDSAYGIFYKLDASLAKNPEYITNASGMGANQFLFNGNAIFEATQFSFRLYGLAAKKDVWVNQEAIGSDYHYKNIVTYVGNNIAKIDYIHTVANAQKIGSMKIDLRTGKVIAD